MNDFDAFKKSAFRRALIWTFGLFAGAAILMLLFGSGDTTGLIILAVTALGFGRMARFGLMTCTSRKDLKGVSSSSKIKLAVSAMAWFIASIIAGAIIGQFGWGMGGIVPMLAVCAWLLYGSSRTGYKIGQQVNTASAWPE